MTDYDNPEEGKQKTAQEFEFEKALGKLPPEARYNVQNEMARRVRDLNAFQRNIIQQAAVEEANAWFNAQYEAECKRINARRLSPHAHAKLFTESRRRFGLPVN